MSADPSAGGATVGGGDLGGDVYSEIDHDRLGRWMDDQGLPGRGETLTSRFITGGASNELFELKRDGHTMALRRPPAVVPKGRNETMLRETGSWPRWAAPTCRMPGPSPAATTPR